MDNYKLYIFDWDGTLMDSIGRIVSSLQFAAVEIGLAPPTEQAAKSIIGLSLSVAIEQLYPTLSEQQQLAFIAAYKQQFLFDNKVPAPLFSHSVEMLAQLKQQNKLLAVATGKARAGLNAMLAQTNTGALFDMTICADESASKPNPEMLETLMLSLSVNSHEAIMIGDSIHDLSMANNAGIDAIGVTMGADDKQRLLAYQPKAIAESMLHLKQLVTGDFPA
ncbi:HAD-IA family hydrolase [Colwellia sp. MEBiC06753]